MIEIIARTILAGLILIVLLIAVVLIWKKIIKRGRRYWSRWG